MNEYVESGQGKLNETNKNERMQNEFSFDSINSSIHLYYSFTL